MRVKLQSLSLKNFKGIREFSTEFSDNTTIMADNGLGKSTIFDAWNWLFFGKDSHNRSDFEVKTLRADGTPIHHLEHEVSACILIDGQERYFKRVLKEKWVKKRGEETPEMSGHETLFFVNNVPYQAGEYKAQVDAVMPEAIFKLVSSPSHFNSLAWKERRNILTSIAGVIPEPEGFDLIKQKAKEIGLSKYKAEISAKKKLLKDELTLIPARIDELSNSVTETVDTEVINNTIKDLSQKIGDINTQIEDSSKRLDLLNKANAEKRKQANDITIKMQEITSKIEYDNRSKSLNRSNKIQQAKDAVSVAQMNVDIVNSTIRSNEELVAKTQIGIDNLRKLWGEENARQLVIKDDELNCPTCKRPLDNIDSLRDEMTASFNAKKAENLKTITDEGKAKKALQDKYNEAIAQAKTDLNVKTIILNDARARYDELINTHEQITAQTPNLEYEALKSQLEAIKYEVITPEDTTGLKAERSSLQLQIDDLKKQITMGEVAKRNQVRIKELEARERELSQLIADLEKIEFQIEGYTRAFMSQVESRVNSMFKYCQFRLFSTLLNGGIEEACETLVNGIPYSPNLNSASRLNSGIDIVNVLSAFYNVTAPLFLDNRESTNEIIPTNSQVINLVVSKDKVLTVINN